MIVECRYLYTRPNKRVVGEKPFSWHDFICYYSHEFMGGWFPTVEHTPRPWDPLYLDLTDDSTPSSFCAHAFSFDGANWVPFSGVYRRGVLSPRENGQLVRPSC